MSIWGSRYDEAADFDADRQIAERRRVASLTRDNSPRLAERLKALGAVSQFSSPLNWEGLQDDLESFRDIRFRLPGQGRTLFVASPPYGEVMKEGAFKFFPLTPEEHKKLFW